MFEQSLDTDLQFLKGVGARPAGPMRKMGLHTIGDLLYHMPRRYEDRVPASG